MSDSEDEHNRLLLDRADSFLARRRAQIGGALLSPSPGGVGADDIPILTDVVRDVVTPSAALAAEKLGADIGREMENWLDENLPKVVLHSLDGFSDQLIARIHESARRELLPKLREALGAPVKLEAAKTAVNSSLALPVSMQSLPDTRVAYMRYIGPYGNHEIPDLWERLNKWATLAGLMSPRRTMYGIGHDDPTITAPENCRYDACIAVDENFAGHGDVGTQTIPGGRFACASFTGTVQEISQAWQWLCGEWLANSAYQFDDGMKIEIYAPDFELDRTTGRFSCQLCIPVRMR